MAKWYEKSLRELSEERQIKFGFPDLLESFLIGALFLFLFLFDVLQNKFQDLGLDYRVHITSGITFNAIAGFWVVILIYHIILMALIVRSVWEKGTHHIWDYIIGALTLIGLFIIIAGAIAGIYFDASEAISWMFNIKQITFYHMGVALQVIGALYFLMTK